LPASIAERNEWGLASLFAQRAVATPRPAEDLLFVDDSVYLWRCLDELGVAAFWAGQRAEGRAATERVLAEGHLPAAERPRVESNLRFYLDDPAGTPGAGQGADQRQSGHSPTRAFRRRILFALGDNFPGGSGYLRGRARRGTHGGAHGLDHARPRRARGARSDAFRGGVPDFEADVVLLQRAFEPHQHPDRLRPALVVVDLDDALFLLGDMPRGMESAVAGAHAFVGETDISPNGEGASTATCR
jgi:hypothetical protein